MSSADNGRRKSLSKDRLAEVTNLVYVFYITFCLFLNILANLKFKQLYSMLLQRSTDDLIVQQL